MWFLLIIGAAGPPRQVAARAMEPLDIGTRREVFFDDTLIDGLAGGATRRLHAPTAGDVVLPLDRPWEGLCCGYPTVFRDGEVIRLYYRGLPDERGEEVTCYAESRDGVTFTRPELGLYEAAGTTANNVIWKREGSHNFAPFLDTNPAAPAEQRYKALGGAPLLAFVSPDGIHWSRLRDEPVITDGAFDSQNLAFWDPLRGEYVAYYRDFADGVRGLKVARSRDFVTWTAGEWLDFGETPAEHLYTNAVSPYYRAPHLYVGFPKRFLPTRQRIAAHGHVGLSDSVFMSSRDGLRWERWREAFIRPGPDADNWTERNLMVAPQPVDAGDGEMAVYWLEHYRHPDIRLRRGLLRVDGFVSVHAGGEPGELLTRPLVFAGGMLRLNFATSAAGWLRLELCDEAGEPLPGFGFEQFEPIFGDATDEAVGWRDAEVATLVGRPVRLRVALFDADLYAFRFADE